MIQNKIKCIVYISFFILVLIPYQINGEEVSSRVKLYEHLSHERYGSNCLWIKPCEEYQQQDVDRNTILYFNTITPEINYDLKIKGYSNIYFEQWISSSRFEETIEVSFTLSDDNMTEIINVSEIFSLGINPTKCDLYVALPHEDVIINQSHNLYMKIEVNYFQGVGLPIQLKIHTSSEYPSGLSLTIKNPIKVELHVSNNPEEKSLHIFALFTTPFGGENIESYDLGIDGPTNERDLLIAIAKYPPSVGSRDWFWSYGEHNPKPGKYIINLNATNCQGIYGEDQYEFILYEDKENLDNSFYWNLAILLIILIIGFLLITYNKRRKQV